MAWRWWCGRRAELAARGDRVKITPEPGTSLKPIEATTPESDALAPSAGRAVASAILLLAGLLGWTTLAPVRAQIATARPGAAPTRSVVVETGLLPIRLTVDRLAGKAGIVLGGGAIEAIGDRIVILVPPGLEYVAAFFGCLYAGAVAVPAYPPNPRRPDNRVARMVADYLF